MASNAAQMDAVYVHQRHFYDLTRKYYLLGRDRLITRLDVPSHGTVLEVGCGTGRNLIAVAKRYPTARLYGLDISEAMLTTARASIARTGLSNRIVLRRADATDFDAVALFGLAAFDRVFFSYTLSMIPDWRAAMAQGAAVTEGALHFVDFGQFELLPRWFAQGLRAWLSKFHVSPRREIFSCVTDDLGRDFSRVTCRALYRDYARSGVLVR